MTEIDTAHIASDEEMEENVRPLVNEILERFNQEGVSVPGGAGNPGPDLPAYGSNA